jgi:hypothetical protein
MTQIEVFIEGGGHNTTLQAELRQGFDALFRGEKSLASENRSSLRFICCGGRQEAYDAFIDSVNGSRNKISALLVDSETSVAPASADAAQDAKTRVEHLRQKSPSEERGQGDGWPLQNVQPEQVHLMVQCMEAWIVADPDALANFYGQDFKRTKLPKHPNLEEESKADLYAKLEAATKDTQKGTYGKIRHASKLLAKIDPQKVSARCVRFRIFREWLTDTIES